MREWYNDCKKNADQLINEYVTLQNISVKRVYIKFNEFERSSKLRRFLLPEGEMRKVVLACVLVLCSFSIACAEWLVDFRDTYVAEGIDKAVENALKNGKTPDLIVENGLALEGLNPQNLVKALYCAGANGQDIRDAAEKYSVSEVILAAGYKKSVAECGDVVADTQAYTPAGNRGPSFTTPRRVRAGWSHVSPHNF
jgi:hypothetical protein